MNQQPDTYQDLRRHLRRELTIQNELVRQASEYLLAVPDVLHLLTKLLMDEAVPIPEKLKLVTALVYFISPIDLVPDFIVGAGGVFDDIALAAYVINSIIRKTSPEVVQRHWAGDAAVLEQVTQLTALAETSLGVGVWKRLKDWV